MYKRILLLLTLSAFTLTTRAAQPSVLGTEVVKATSGSSTDQSLITPTLKGASSETALTVNGSGIIVAGNLSVLDDPYGSGWNASTDVPTKNAVYDKIESLVVSGSQTPLTADVDAAGFGITGADLFKIGSGTDASGDSRFLIADTKTGTGNGHGFADDSTFSRAGYAYNTFDLKTVFADSKAYDHYAGVQPRVNLGAGSSFNNVYLLGASTVNTLGSGSIITNLYSIYVPPISNSGSISNYYGIYFGGIPSGTMANSWGIYIANGGGFFGGSTPYQFAANVAADSLTVTNAAKFSGLTGQTLMGLNSSKTAIAITPGARFVFGNTLLFRESVNNKSTSYTIATTDTGKTFRSSGSGDVVGTLPSSPTSGDTFVFIVGTAFKHTITNISNFYLGDTGPGTSISSSSVGSTATVTWDGTEWVTTTRTGTWAQP